MIFEVGRLTKAAVTDMAPKWPQSVVHVHMTLEIPGRWKRLWALWTLVWLFLKHKCKKMHDTFFNFTIVKIVCVCMYSHSQAKEKRKKKKKIVAALAFCAHQCVNNFKYITIINLCKLSSKNQLKPIGPLIIRKIRIAVRISS